MGEVILLPEQIDNITIDGAAVAGQLSPFEWLPALVLS